jgi:hypothetical protein
MALLRYLAAFVLLASFLAVAQDLPDAPAKVLDKKFMALSFLSTATSFSDSYTTTWARENWLAGKTGVCNIERESTYLYGTHPTPGRAYAVAAGKSITSIAASYYLRKHRSRLWGLPMVVNAMFGMQGTVQNMVMCN